MIKAIYDLDMTPRRSLPIIINVSQNDDLGRTLVFNLFSSTGTWTAPDSATATLEGGKPDGKFFSFNCTYSKGAVTAIIQQQMTAVSGKVTCKVKVQSGSKVIESAPIYMMVDAAGIPDGADMSKSDVNDAVEEATKKIVEQVAGSIPEDYSNLDQSVNELIKKAYSSETYLKDISNLLTINGFLNKSGELVASVGLSTDFIKVRAKEELFLYVSQDDNNSLPLAIYDKNKKFIKGVENKGHTYISSRFSYVVESECYIRVSTMNDKNSAIYLKTIQKNSEVFDEIKSNIGELETYYEDKTDYILESGEDNKFINKDGVVQNYQKGFVSDFIEVSEGDKIEALSYVLFSNPAIVLFYSSKAIYGVAGTEIGMNRVSLLIPKMVKYIRIGSLDKSKGIKFSIQKSKSAVEMINKKADAVYEIPNTYEEMLLENTTTGYITKKAETVYESNYISSDYIDLDNFDWFKLVTVYGYSACAYVIFDEKIEVLDYKENASNTTYRNELDVKAIREEYKNAKYIRFCGTPAPIVYIRKKANLIGKCAEESMNTGNILYNKKIAFCGDSFTQAVNLGKDFYDQYWGCYKSYGWRIANRNKMKLYHDGIGGSTMHITNSDSPDTNSPFAYQRYKNVPDDCDYIILQFGLNESSIANTDSTKGDKSSVDTTTMWGSWNVVLKYLIENHPIARIGVIMSDAWMPQSYYLTLKEICEWWGIPLLDLGGDSNVPVMNGGRRKGCGLTLNPEVATLRNKTFYSNYESGDAHPNDAGHEWRSTVIENWIRSL